MNKDVTIYLTMWMKFYSWMTYLHNDRRGKYVTEFVKTCPLCTQRQELLSWPINDSINKLTNYHNTTAKSWLICFFWGLFLRPVRRPLVLGCSLIATGWLAQAATLLKITTWLVHDVNHGFIYILWHFECLI